MLSNRYTHTHTKLKNFRRNNLKIKYQHSLSAEVSAITTRRITPEIIPDSALLKKLLVNGSLYENDILAAYFLGRIHQNIYRLEESLIFLMFFQHHFRMFILYICLLLF